MKLVIGKVYKCVYCGFRGVKTFGTSSVINLDHFKPKSKFPELKKDPKNKVISCFVCNIIKNNKVSKTIEEAREHIEAKKLKNPKLVERIIKTYGLDMTPIPIPIPEMPAYLHPNF